MKLHFLGAVRQVTGSRYCLEAAGLRLLIDYGMFQERSFLERNWEPCPLPPKGVDFLLLTHAHLDHAGLIPKLVREGFHNPILTTAASADVTKILLLDSGRIHEEDARYKKKRHEREGRRGPHPEIPLYTAEEATAVFPLLQETPYDERVYLNDHVWVRFHDAGHILGSAMIEIGLRENGRERRLIFSGDIGQWDKPIVRDPSLFERADYLVMESTYGDRDHEDHGEVTDRLEAIINDTVARGGNVVIPTFAIERAQELMYYLSRLVREDRIPHLLIFLDSPMAVNVTDVFRQHPECMDEEAQALFQSGQSPFAFPGMQLIRSVDESKAINRIKGSCIIMAGSGMCTGGRIKHHLVQNIGNPHSTILFVGYQARDTLGRQIVEGRPQVRIHGQQHSVRARIEQLHGLSAHADRSALLRWATRLESPPECIFVTHGEEETALAFAQTLREQTKWNIRVPQYQEEWQPD